MQTQEHIRTALKTARSERTRLDQAIASLEKLELALGGGGEALPPVPVASGKPRTATKKAAPKASAPRKQPATAAAERTPRGSLLDNIKSILLEAGGPLGTKAISDLLVERKQTSAKSPYSSVYSTLAKSGGKVGIENIGNGVWAVTHPKAKSNPKPAAVKPVVEGPPPDLDAVVDSALDEVEEVAAAAAG